MSTTATAPRTTISEMQNDATMRVPSDAFEARLFRGRIEQELSAWPNVTVSLQGDGLTGTWDLLVTPALSDARPVDWAGFFSGPELRGIVWLADISAYSERAVEVVWCIDSGDAEVLPQANTSEYRPVAAWMWAA